MHIISLEQLWINFFLFTEIKKLLSDKFDTLKTEIKALSENIGKIKEARDTIATLENKIKNISDEMLVYNKNVNSKYKNITSTVGDIQIGINEFTTLIVDKRNMSDDKDIISFPKLVSLHKLQLPMITRENFIDFESKLKDEKYKELKSDLVKYNLFILF